MTPPSGCDVCRASANGGRDYFALAFGNPHHWSMSGESVADCFGFCARHGAQLLGAASLRRAIAEVFKDAIPRVLLLLPGQRFGDEASERVYFGARDACPACAYETRIAGRQAASCRRRLVDTGADAEEQRPRPVLCGPHFQVVARRVPPLLRMPAIAGRIDALERQVAAFEGRAAAGPGWESRVDGEALSRALPWVCGFVAPAPPGPAETAVGQMPESAPFEQIIAFPDACPVCVAVERARTRWMKDLPLAASHGLDGWLFFPTCPAHVADVASLGDAELTAVVVGHAMHVEAEHLHQQLRALVRAAESEEELDASRIARWSRRPRRRKPGAPRPPMPRLVRCAACERMAIAELQATAKLLRLLHGERHRHAFEHGYGLCMKHHAQAYLLSPRGEVRSLLATDQAQRLTDLLQVLTAATEGRATPSPAFGGDDDPLPALRRFCRFG